MKLIPKLQAGDKLIAQSDNIIVSTPIIPQLVKREYEPWQIPQQVLSPAHRSRIKICG